MKKTEMMKERVVADLQDDLLTALEAYMDVMDNEELFYEAMRYMTFTLYETMQNHKLSLKVLRAGMDEGIKQHIEKKGH